ncbi:MAG TPA: hypothetical protein VNN08_11455 [Thermoanaerobaculia bacterium]|nr:hypothetical protein [Thermoanaerobaculia bacterium]
MNGLADAMNGLAESMNGLVESADYHFLLFKIVSSLALCRSLLAIR